MGKGDWRLRSRLATRAAGGQGEPRAGGTNAPANRRAAGAVGAVSGTMEASKAIPIRHGYELWTRYHPRGGSDNWLE
jgi:hypothetical protein